MRSAVSVILSGSAPEQNMSYPDYQQTPHDHQSLLVVVRHIGKLLINVVSIGQNLGEC